MYLENKTILVVEDHDSTRKVITAFLAMNRYRVLEAVSAETGIELANSCSPDLILMDINLPGMDGLNATTILKENSRTENIPVIVMTALNVEDVKEKATAVGCWDFFQKPFNVRTLLECVNRCLEPITQVFHP